MGCGRIAPKDQLLRIALANAREGAPTSGTGTRGEPAARAVLDSARTMPGRGAYLCRGAQAQLPARSCLALATRRGALSRALRCPVRLDQELVESVGR